MDIRFKDKNFSGADLIKANFRGKDLGGANFYNANFQTKRNIYVQ